MRCRSRQAQRVPMCAPSGRLMLPRRGSMPGDLRHLSCPDAGMVTHWGAVAYRGFSLGQMSTAAYWIQ